jgi:hypothetical protein
MKPSPSKSTKTGAGKKRSREEAAASAGGSTPPVSSPRPNPNKEWKKSKAKTEDLLALLNSGFLREKEFDMWRAAVGDLYPMEKNPDEIPMFARFVESGLALPASDFFTGLLHYYGIEYLNLNPNGIFHISVLVHFCEAFLGIKPHWVLFRKFFRVKPQPSANDLRVVKDRFGDQSGGSEWEPIKNLLKNLAYAPKSLLKNLAHTCQDHVVTTDLLTIGTS